MTKPVELDFYGKNLTQLEINKVCAQFAQQIIASPNAHIVLDLSANQLNEESILSLKDILMHPQLMELRIDDNNLNSCALDYLFQFLAQRQNALQALSLSGNQLSMLDVQALTQSLFNRNGLSYLNLSGCGLSPEGIIAIARAVETNESLRKLILSNNNVGTAVTDIAQMLQHNKYLDALYLCQCELPLEESKALGQAVAYHPTLREFNIESNDLPPSFTTAFLEDLAFNNVLTDYMGPDINDEIQNICKRNVRIPCTTPWSAEYNPLADIEQRMASLVVNTQPTHETTLTFRAAQNVIRRKKLNAETFGITLSTSILDSTYAEACKRKLQ